MSATIASIVAFESGSSCAVFPPTGQNPLTEWPSRNRFLYRSGTMSSDPSAYSGIRARASRTRATRRRPMFTSPSSR